MDDFTTFIKAELSCHGADIVGIGDLFGLPPWQRCNMPVGICVAVKYSKEVIRGIIDLPTREYYEQYNILNEKLDMLVKLGASALIALGGYKAIPLTMDIVKEYETDYTTMLPYKTVATLAGIGWIGKSALLVTKKYGSMLRISSILTDAPLRTAKPIKKSRCADCIICTKVCPANAISGKNWSVDTYRDEFYDAYKCRNVARERALQGIGIEITQCGKCIVSCPYTQQYLSQEG